jgi:hypothetical protein
MRQYRDNKTYFAAAPIEEIGDRLSGKVSEYYSYLTSSALVDLWRRSFYSYYGLLDDTALSGFGIFAIGKIRQSGAEGEMASIKVNHLRNLITHLLVLTTNQRPQLKCRAVNSDSESLSQAYLGDGIIDYYMREKKIEKYLRNAVETALVFGEGFIRIDWDERKGKEYGVSEDGNLRFEGDVTCENYHPFNVIRDVTNPNTDVDWYICHDCKNRFDIAVKYPHAEEQILNISTDVTSGRRYVDPTKIIPAAGVGTNHTELIDVYSFIHSKTDAIPEGRFTVFLEDGTVLFDGPLAFKEPPIYRISASDLIGTPFGYTVSFDLLGIQQIVDKLYSIVCSNQLSSGVQNFWQPPGNQLTKMQIAGGLNLLESVTKPEVLEMLSTPKEVFAFIERLEKIMETISGVSSVNRGEVPTTLKSGSSLAFVAAQALTFSSDLQNSYNQLQESVGTGLIHILQDFVDYEKQAVIAGKFNRPLMKTYTGKDLSNIDRVIVETTSAVSKTPSGKMQIAQDLLQSGFIRSAREYISCVATGNLESLYESEMSEIILIKAENEDMRDYRAPIMLASDDHKLHYLEHRAILGNPDARKDAQLTVIVTQHMMDHFNMAMQLQNNNPGLLAWMGESPLPMAMGPVMPGAPGQEMQPPPSNMAAMANAQTPMQQEAAKVQQPRMPGLPAGSDENAQEGYEQMKGNMQ